MVERKSELMQVSVLKYLKLTELILIKDWFLIPFLESQVIIKTFLTSCRLGS